MSKVVLNVKNQIYIIFFILLLIFSCKSAPEPVQEIFEIGEVIEPEAEPPVHNTGGLADEIRGLSETGILSSMLQANELIRSRDLSGSDFGRIILGLNTILIRYVYPDSLTRLPVIDLPQTSNYTRIIRETERGNYVRPSESSNDFYEHILPFLAINEQTGADIRQAALIDLEKAQRLHPSSVLPHYFSGLIHEWSGSLDRAISSYKMAYEISNIFYPAQICIARVTRLLENSTGAVSILSELVVIYPDSMEIKRELALSYYLSRDWSRALPAIEEILQTQPRDDEFMLMRAYIMIDQGHYSQANASLDNFASISTANAANKNYLYMRARVQFEGNRNRDSALNYLRSIFRTDPDDVEALIYAVTLLMDSQRPADQTESRELLTRLRRAAGSSIDVLSLSLRDAVRRENWQEAQGYLNSILGTRRTAADLTDGYYIESGLGNNARALIYARELYDRDTSNNDYLVIYISALIDNGSRDEASRLIENRLNSVTNSQIKSRFYYLRSRLRANTNDALSDLRSSLFEDPRNLDAIIAMFEIYHNSREERRAVYYLRQALAIAPDNPLLRRYEIEYAALLGRN